jgi:hypothetical protein
MSQKKSLGLVPLDQQTVEHDFTMLERYQGFSAELLRLALLGISAIGFGVSKVVFPDKSGLSIPEGTKIFLALALLAFCVAAASSLLHRYASADSMSWHLQAMRRYAKGDAGEIARADAEARQRFKKFKMSKAALAAASLSLGIGAASLALAVWQLI